MDLKETQEFVQVMQRLSRMYDTLVPLAATEAVNFSKERFRAQNWLGNTTQPWKKRKEKKRAKSKGRAILVLHAVLKRDIHKEYVGRDKAIISTSKLTVPYAKAHNEGFRGTVVVPEHKRSRFKKVKESYTTRKGNKRTRTSKQVDASKEKITVRTHNMKMNLPKRQFVGASPVLDKKIERMITAQFIKALKGTNNILKRV